MAQGRRQLGRMLDVSTTHSRPNIVHKHLANALGTMLLMQEILTEDRSGNFRHMFVLGNGSDFSLGQSAHTNAVFK
jgi:hypothetical protein